MKAGDPARHEAVRIHGVFVTHGGHEPLTPASKAKEQ